MTQLPFAGRGVVDLSALRAPAPAAGPAADGAAAEYVFDVREADFQARVLEQSLTVPVVIDLWADWCGPCKQLSPVLERLAAQGQGRWLLAKIDVDANQQLAAAFGTQSIPAVFAVVAGQLVPMFTGALPEPDVRQYLDELLRLAAEQGVTGRAEPGRPGPADDVPAGAEPALSAAVQQGMDALARGDLDAALAAFERELADRPGEEVAISGVAQVALVRRLADVDPGDVLRRAAAEPTDIEAQLLAADVEFAGQQIEAAFGRLLERVRLETGQPRERIRRHLIELFDILGSGEPRVVRARQALTSALF